MAFDLEQEVARRRAGKAPRPTFMHWFAEDAARAFYGCFPVVAWPHTDLPPEGVNGVTVHDAGRPYFRDEAGRRWLLDGSGDVA